MQGGDLSMKLNRVKRVVTKTIVAVILLVSAWAVTGTTAQAQGRRGFYRHDHPRVFVRPRVFIAPRVFTYPRLYPYGTYRVYDPIAYQREQGYSDGRSRGKDDAHHEKPYSPDSHKHYRNASSITYREAFLQGYAEGYRDYAG